MAPSVEQFKGYPCGLLGGAKRLLDSAGSAGRGLGLFSTAGLAKVLRAGAVMADCADAPPQVNAGRPKATGAVVAPSLHGVLMGGWHRRWNGPREAVEWQAARLKTVQRRKPFFASRRMHFFAGFVSRLLVDLCHTGPSHRPQAIRPFHGKTGADAESGRGADKLIQPHRQAAIRPVSAIGPRAMARARGAFGDGDEQRGRDASCGCYGRKRRDR